MADLADRAKVDESIVRKHRSLLGYNDDLHAWLTQRGAELRAARAAELAAARHLIFLVGELRAGRMDTGPAATPPGSRPSPSPAGGSSDGPAPGR